MSRPEGSAHPHRCDHIELERELADLEVRTWGLEAKLANLQAEARTEAEAELARLKGRVAGLRTRLGR